MRKRGIAAYESDRRTAEEVRGREAGRSRGGRNNRAALQSRRWGPDILRGVSFKEFDNLPEGAKAGHVLWLDFRQTGDALLDSGEDLDAFDGIDAEAGFEFHVEAE